MADLMGQREPCSSRAKLEIAVTFRRQNQLKFFLVTVEASAGKHVRTKVINNWLNKTSVGYLKLTKLFEKLHALYGIVDGYASSNNPSGMCRRTLQLSVAA